MIPDDAPAADFDPRNGSARSSSGQACGAHGGLILPWCTDTVLHRSSHRGARLLRPTSVRLSGGFQGQLLCGSIPPWPGKAGVPALV